MTLATPLPAPRIFLSGEGTLWRAELLDGDSLPWGHRYVEEMNRADAVFLWAWKAMPSTAIGYEIGLAVALMKPIYVGAYDFDSISALHAALGRYQQEIVHRHIQAISVHTSVRDAYEHALADVDVLLPDMFKLTQARSDGMCRGCGGSYKKGDAVRYARNHGALHADCYANRKNPEAFDAALFNSALVDAVRAENAELEKKLRERGH